MDVRGTTRRWTGGVVAGAGESLVTGLPVEAADALVVDTVFLVVSWRVAGETEGFFRCGVAEGKVVKFLEERESIKVFTRSVSCLYMMVSVVLMFLRWRFAW